MNFATLNKLLLSYRLQGATVYTVSFLKNNTGMGTIWLKLKEKLLLLQEWKVTFKYNVMKGNKIWVYSDTATSCNFRFQTSFTNFNK